MPPYDPKDIEQKWQKKWFEEKIFRAKEGSPRPKYYQLETFPYPSAAGLHVGHPKGYIAEDIHARYMRMHGKEVLYTMGWDAFGLPTENYAIKVGRSPKEVAKENTDHFRRQVQMFGFSYDWDRELDTSSPEYYKWTQWLFIQLFKKGLAYRAEARVNWCPKDQTVLANEQVIDGKCERDGSVIEQREMEQWFFKITDYAERLIADLKGLDWPAATVKRQEDWIGKSEGAEIDFPLNWPPPEMELVFATNNEEKLKRMQKLFSRAGLKITLKTPKEIGIKEFDVAEDGILRENAEKKARAVAALTGLPVLADDSGFFIEGAEIDPITVKRNALAGIDEKTLTIEEIARRVQKYYQDIASSHGGKMDAEWRNALCFITPEKFAVHTEAVRPVILTDELHGTVDPYLPLRGLYISKATGKYALEQTEEEEMRELQPIVEGLKKLFTPAIRVFTTRPDTLFGATYMVLAPEHPFVQACVRRKALQNNDEVFRYIEQAKHKTELARKEEAGEKTGVELKGVKAIHPATKEKIPIWVADYVFMGYGTGAIMAVPAHDERDAEFAKKFKLPIRQVIEPLFVQNVSPGEVVSSKPFVERQAIMAVVKHWKEDKYIGLKWKKVDWQTVVTGGVESGRTPEQSAVAEIIEETGYLHPRLVKELGINHSKFFHVPKQENRFGHFHMLYFILEDEERKDISDAEKEIHEVLWLSASEMEKFLSPSSHKYAWSLVENPTRVFAGEGILANSGEFSGMDSEKAKWEITKFVGGQMKTQYKLRDWSVSRQRYWGVPIPMIHCSKCGIVPVLEKDLPVLLPELKNYRPKGVPPLGSSEEFINVKCPNCEGKAQRDPETLDTFVDSSWYYLRYADPHNSKEPFEKKKAEHWLPVDLYVIGAEHTVLHLLYSRFITKFLHDEGYVSFSEPFLKLRHQGLIRGADDQKMSKSKGNVVNPDELIAEFGADTLRMYEMFMGPFEEGAPWDPRGILGINRFLKRFWKYATGEETEEKREKAPAPRALLEKTIKKVEEDIESFKFNTAISAFMILLNELETAQPLEKKDMERLIKIIHPFAPHLGQELWSRTRGRSGEKNYLDFEPWPEYDPALIAEEEITLVLQVNGRVRATVSAEASLTEEAAKEIALANPKIKSILGAQTPKKIIYVHKKLVNIVL